MQLTSLLFSSAPADVADGLAPVVRQNIDSLKQWHPQGEHALFFEAQAREFIQSHFSTEVVRAFDTLRPYAYKADLARYCILHQQGGIYADLSYFFVNPLPVTPDRIVVFRDFFWSSPWDTSNGMIAAPPRHKALQRAIELVCENVRRGYYGPTALCPTGPALWGKALASTCDPDELIAGSAVLFDRATVQTSLPEVSLPAGSKLHCLVLQKKIVAIKRKPVGAPGLSSLGVQGSDSYAQLWKQRDIYRAPGDER